MPKARYLQLTPSRDGRLNLSDSKAVIEILQEVSGNDPFELIIKSQAGSGLEIYVSANEANIDSIKRHIYTFSADLDAPEVKKAQVHIRNPTTIQDYKFSRHYAYPLFCGPEPSEDSLSKLMHCLAQIDSSETVELRLSAVSAKPLKAWLLKRRLLSGQSPKLYDPSLSGYIKRILLVAITAVVSVARSILYLIENLIYSVARDRYSLKPVKVISPKSVMLLDKLYEPLFKVRLTLSIKAVSPKRATALAKDIAQSLNGFASASGYQQFKASKPKKSADIYSSSDLAAIYRIAKSDLGSGIYKLQQFKALPLPASLNKPKLPGDVALGFNSHLESSKDIILSSDARMRHLYITGATGSGKSTLLANLILQDIESGQGLSLIDPHGDLAAYIKSRLPKNRLDDVIYFDPSDHKSKLGINLLDITARPGTPQYLQEVDQVTESIISLFRKVFSGEDSSGHRVEYILRNAIHTAIEIPGSTIFTIFRLLTDSAYRLEVIPTIKDKNLANFWRNELGRAGEYQRVKMTAGVTSKIGRFLFSEPSRRVFGQPCTTLDVASLMNDRRILICDFSKGKLGEDGSKLFSTALLTKIQLAALGRVGNTAAGRPAHYLYVDEFQNHAPSVMIQMLSEARKYGLYLTMAEQSPYQQDASSTKVIMGNVGNLLCFRTALPRDEGLLMPNFERYLSSRDLNDLPAYKFYFKSTAEESLPPTAGQSYPLPEATENKLYDAQTGLPGKLLSPQLTKT